MVQLSRCINSKDDIAVLFSDAALARALPEASAVLAQVFWNDSTEAALDEVCRAISSHAPGAMLVGASSAGQIAEGVFVPEGVVVSISCFSRATLKVVSLDVVPGGEAEAGRTLAESLADCIDLQAALLFAPTSEIDAASILGGMREAFPPWALFGGGAADGAEPCSGILYEGKLLPRGVVAVAFCGPDLHVETSTLFDWRPLGPAFILTDVRGSRIRSIDGKPAFDHYKKNLDIEDGDDLHLLEFPLLIERDGALVARNIHSAEADGCIRIAADAFIGETARLGFLDMKTLTESIDRTALSLRAFRPEGIFLYSCVCRLFTLQEDIELETMPFQGIAPTSGFYTLGEFCRLGGKMQLLNSSEVIVSLREGPPPALADLEEIAVFASVNPNRERHVRMTSRLFCLIGALTERIETANKALVLKNGQLAASNEVLCAEVAWRKRAEEREKAIVSEKEILLRELQHRVKNNMSVISSIASIEAMQSRSPEVRSALGKLESRIAALASLYDILYVTGDVEKIALADYLGRVVDYAAEGLGADAKGIAIHRSIEQVRIDVKRAISIGLIVNELVTDAIKYAFPTGGGGRIDVRLEREDGELDLIVEDDGVGLPSDLDTIRASGFGLSLVRSLALQLDAELSTRSEGGARFELRMPL
jgi:two-component sensor histidine kinase